MKAERYYFLGVESHFLVLCFFWLIVLVDGINKCVLQEAGDANSRVHTRSQVEVEYFIIHYTSTFIRLSHSTEEFCVHCIVIMNYSGMG